LALPTSPGNKIWLVWTDWSDRVAASWPLQKAKNQFSRVVDRAMSEGPQTVTRHGKPVVIVSAVATRAAKGGTARRLLSLLRRCPVDLTGIVKRDRSVSRKIDL
jgi:prevent-host-death family protein